MNCRNRVVNIDEDKEIIWQPGDTIRSATCPPYRENVKASCEKVVLTIILPKREETKPKQINVEVK
jgi:hypothetical protein